MKKGNKANTAIVHSEAKALLLYDNLDGGGILETNEADDPKRGMLQSIDDNNLDTFTHAIILELNVHGVDILSAYPTSDSEQWPFLPKGIAPSAS